MASKNFNIYRAHELCSMYKEKRQYSKLCVVSQLITFYNLSSSHSIIGMDIRLPYCCPKKTVKAVCEELGYTLTSFSNPKQSSLLGTPYGRGTIFTFVE